MIFRAQARRRPDRTALLWHDRAWTYGEVLARIERRCEHLAKHGVGAGDRVLLATSNRPEFFVVQHAVEELGGLAVTLSPRVSVPELVGICRQVQPVMAFFDEVAMPAMRAARAQTSCIPAERMLLLEEADGEGASSAPAPSVVAAPRTTSERTTRTPPTMTGAGTLLYTSGSSGAPKAAVRAPGRATAAAMLRFLADTPMAAGGVHLLATPLYHATAQAFANLSFLSANPVLLMARFEPEAFLAAVERYGVAHAALVPAMLHRILALGPDTLARYDTRSLRALFSISAPLSPSLAEAAMRAFGEIVYNLYGATELGLVTVAAPADSRRCPGTIGRPLPGVCIRLLDDRGRDVPQGEPGRLYVKSPSRMAGYFGNAGAPESTIEDGYMTVGDLARLDEHGMLEWLGRTSEIINTGGVKVHPAEIEAALEAHPAVREAAVWGVHDERWGERVVAFVVLTPSAATAPPSNAAIERALREQCTRLFSPEKRPREYRFLAELPRTAIGKLDRRRLAEPGDLR